MADIFISHSPLDHERVKPLGERLTSLGYSVWWDKPDRTRRIAVAERERAFEAARTVLTAWSAIARHAPLVHAESARAWDDGRLVQLKLDPVAPAPPFDGIAAYDLSGAAEWGPLEHALAQRTPHDGAAPQITGPMPVLAVTGAPKLVTVALTASLAAHAGAVGAAWNGVMSLGQLQAALIGVLAVAGACAALSALRLVLSVRADG